MTKTQRGVFDGILGLGFCSNLQAQRRILAKKGLQITLRALLALKTNVVKAVYLKTGITLKAFWENLDNYVVSYQAATTRNTGNVCVIQRKALFCIGWKLSRAAVGCSLPRNGHFPQRCTGLQTVQ